MHHGVVWVCVCRLDEEWVWAGRSRRACLFKCDILCLIWVRSVSEQGGEEGHVYSNVVFCLIWVRSECEQGGQEGHVFQVWYFIMEFCLIWARSECEQVQEGRVYSSVRFYYGILIIWVRRVCKQGGQEGHVYSSVIFYCEILFHLGEECVWAGRSRGACLFRVKCGILLSIMEFCLSAYELVMSQVRLLQLSLSLISHRAM